MSRLLLCAMVAAAVYLPGASASANMSYSPWIHELVQKGQDMEVTVNIFEEASIETYHGVPFPSFDVSYTLTRFGNAETMTVFEDRIFDKEEAVGVSERECQYDGPAEDAMALELCAQHPDDCSDCDGDGVKECADFCAVAYRFTVIDKCVPPDGPTDGGGVYYSLSSRELEEMSEEFVADEKLGSENVAVEDTGDPCLEEDDTTPDAEEDVDTDGSGCSTSTAGRRKTAPIMDRIALLL